MHCLTLAVIGRAQTSIGKLHMPRTHNMSALSFSMTVSVFWLSYGLQVPRFAAIEGLARPAKLLQQSSSMLLVVTAERTLFGFSTWLSGGTMGLHSFLSILHPPHRPLLTGVLCPIMTIQRSV